MRSRGWARRRQLTIEFWTTPQRLSALTFIVTWTEAVRLFVSIAYTGEDPVVILDKTRTQSQDAQDRLQRARERTKGASNNGNRSTAASEGSSEQIIAARAPTAGAVRAISVQVGQLVTTGHLLATLVTRTD